MRTVLNISMPNKMAKQIEEEVKNGNFSSKSEFMRAIFRAWEEEKLYQELRRSKREIREGKGVLLKSLRDLR